MKNLKKAVVIGVLGGMGTYATIDLFKKYAKLFPAEKEWDRPRIIIDNNCTMPSRVRAVLYNENKEVLINEMVRSVENMLNCGVTHLILACNTSHIFLKDVYKYLPEAERVVVNIIDECIAELKSQKVKEVYLLATEGTILSGIYQRKLSAVGISCCTPQKDEFSDLRLCIEAVKQNKYNNEIETKFVELVNRGENCVLGCTELPILFERCSGKSFSGGGVEHIFDPLYIALKKVKKDYIKQ